MSNGTISSSYSPIGTSIINANAYRAAVLMDAFSLTNDKKMLENALQNIEFIISHQNNDGSWFYEAKGIRNNFIDNFHTCFVIKNLFKCYKIYNDNRLRDSIISGYDYYNKFLFYENGRQTFFSKSKYFKLRKYEMYDYAEGISLGILTKSLLPNAIEKANWLAKDLVKNFQTKQGYFCTRITSLGTRHTVPYHRWPQAQIFYSLTSLLKEKNNYVWHCWNY